MCIDRLSLILPLQAEDQNAVVPYLTSLKLDADVAGAAGIVPAGWKAKAGGPVALHVKVPVCQSPLIWSADNAAIIQVKAGKGKQRYLRLEIFPLGLTALGFTHIYEVVLRDHLFLLPSQILSARVSRVDIALDLKGVRLKDFAWSVEGRRVHRSWVKSGCLETIYLGSSKHGAPCFYDKAKQQKLGGDVAWTRVELRPKPNLPLGSLPALKNPFSGVRPYDVRAACGAVNVAPIWGELALGYAQLLGSRELLARFPDSVGHGASKSPRARLSAALTDTVPAWWKPDDYWKLWPAALAGGLPGLFG